MGSTQSGPGSESGIVPSSITAIPQDFVTAQTTGRGAGDASGPGRTLVQRRQQGLAAYVEACSAASGVVPRTFASDAAFESEVSANVPTVYRYFLRKGQRRFVIEGVFYFVLVGAEVKLFQAHCRGLETMAFLGLPQVVCPATALVSFLGVRIACVVVHPLHSMVRLDLKGVQQSTHVTVVRAMLSRVLRLRDEPTVVFYYSGSGSLVAVDATSLLPTLCAPPLNGKYFHQARPELLLCADWEWAPTVSGTLVYARGEGPGPAAAAASGMPAAPLPPPRPSSGGTAAVVGNAGALSYVGAVLNAAAAGKKKSLLLPTLNAISSLLVPNTTVLSESVLPIGAPVTSTEISGYETMHSAGCKENLTLSQAVYGPLIAATLVTLEEMGDDVSSKRFADALRSAGVGMHMLGALWRVVEARNPRLRVRVACEMAARAAKRWLELELTQQQQAPQFERTLMDLVRNLTEASFIQGTLMPLAAQMFGALEPAPPTAADVVFRNVFERLQTLTGATVAGGKLVTVQPRCRVVRQEYTVSDAEAQVLATNAAHRDDGIGGMLILASAARWSFDVTRHARLVTQLRKTYELGDGNRGMQLLVCVVEFDLTDLCVKAKQHPTAMEFLQRAVALLLPACREQPHDRLFLARRLLQLADLQAAHESAARAVATVGQLLQLAPFIDPAAYSPLTTRGLVEELHRLSVETCAATRQAEEALAVAQRWHKLCSGLFGDNSRQMCRAWKLMLIGLIKCRRRAEALRCADQYIATCRAVFGDRDVRTAGALADGGSLVWRRNPGYGLHLYQLALDIFRKVGHANRGVCTTVYNMGLAQARLNQFRAALSSFARAREIALELGEENTVRLCDGSARTVRSVAATKLQRWFRELSYGQAKSQTTRTEGTTLCSALSCSDDLGDIESHSTNDLTSF